MVKKLTKNRKTTRRRQLRKKAIHNRTTELTDKLVVNDCNFPLNENHKEALARGCSFIPTPTKAYDPSKDLNQLQRNLNLKIHWAGKEPSNYKRSLFSNIIKSPWEPPTFFSQNHKEWNDFTTSTHKLTQTEKPNISKKVLDAWKELTNNKNFYLVKADKGGGMVLWKRDDYRKEAMRQLSDTSTYEPLCKQQVDELKIILKYDKANFLNKLKLRGHITENEINRAKSTTTTFPPIYFLPKIHKSKRTDTETFAGRPIIAATNGPFKILDTWLATLTAPLLKHIPGSLKDTTDLINSLKQVKATPESILFSADVESLYPSIPWEEGFNAATAFYATWITKLQRLAKENNQLPPPSPSLFREALEMVLKNNIFHYQNTLWYRQTSGTAMGCSISVYLANTFMYYRTRSIIRNPPIGLIAMFRYIDDIICVYTGDEKNISSIFNNTIDDNIKLTFVIGGKQLEALDLKLHLLPNGTIETSLYRKPTDNHQFVHWASHHPNHLKKSLPYSQFIRIKRNCSRNEDFETEALELIKRFRARKYPHSVLIDARNKARARVRDDLLTPKEKTTTNDRITIVTTYQREWAKHFRQQIETHYHKIRNSWTGDSNPLPNTTPRIAYRTHEKLGKKLGPTFKLGLKPPRNTT